MSKGLSRRPTVAPTSGGESTASDLTAQRIFGRQNGCRTVSQRRPYVSLEPLASPSRPIASNVQIGRGGRAMN